MFYEFENVLFIFEASYCNLKYGSQPSKSIISHHVSRKFLDTTPLMKP